LILPAAYFFVQLTLSTYGKSTFNLMWLWTNFDPYFALTAKQFYYYFKLLLLSCSQKSVFPQPATLCT
jgi:hypothetical protein